MYFSIRTVHPDYLGLSRRRTALTIRVRFLNLPPSLPSVAVSTLLLLGAHPQHLEPQLWPSLRALKFAALLSFHDIVVTLEDLHYLRAVQWPDRWTTLLIPQYTLPYWCCFNGKSKRYRIAIPMAWQTSASLFRCIYSYIEANWYALSRVSQTVVVE